jgi:hypothetical protein
MRTFTRIGREGGPDPFEFVIMLFLAFGGASTLTHLGTPSSITKVLDEPILIVWGILLSLGSITAFVGIVWPYRETTALVIEQIGLIAVAGASLIYAVVLLSQLESIQGASVLTAFVGGFGTAAVWRAFRIGIRQRAIIRFSREMPDKDGA